ncbi:hypothetical protein HPC49_11495 [Pyxidicoccus fallax]|uniref:Leucine-rich repeat domain-containing protein n=1 Tax=Pyxidicoccus fallax TaxID=394095 RepID=A0A848LHR3_9BACT|nr:hypothetical protein [Pyxidicoccus fallax]NMO17081.1 hypothetical protein [Pyxidicoccus fallax]NPC78863.1 hypothetical protein [Pyxidicoccus fallax]
MWDGDRWVGGSEEELFATVRYELEVDPALSSWDPGITGQLRFTDTDPSVNWTMLDQRLLEVLRRLRTSDGPHAAALRNEVRSLVLNTHRLGGPLDLSCLTGLTALERVCVHSHTGITGVSALGELPALRSATLVAHENRSIQGLEGISRSQSLEFLKFSYGRLGDLRGLSGLRTLRRLYIYDTEPISLTGIEELPLEEVELCTFHNEWDLTALASLRALRLLDYQGPLSLNVARALAKCRVPRLVLPQFTAETDPAAIAALPDAEELEMRLQKLGTAPVDGRLPVTALSVPSLDDAELRQLARAPRLRSLYVRVLKATNLDPLADLAELQELRFDSARKLRTLDRVPNAVFIEDRRLPGAPNRLLLRDTPLTSIRQLGRLRGVDHLDLRGCTGLTSLWGLEGMDSLRSIDLRGCSGLVDMSSLAALPGLRAIIANDQGPIEPFPLSVYPRVFRSNLRNIVERLYRGEMDTPDP